MGLSTESQSDFQSIVFKAPKLDQDEVCELNDQISIREPVIEQEFYASFFSLLASGVHEHAQPDDNAAMMRATPLVMIRK